MRSKLGESAATVTAPGHAAGFISGFPHVPSLPADATITTPDSVAVFTEAHSVSRAFRYLWVYSSRVQCHWTDLPATC